MAVSKDIRYIGVNDREIDLFEGQYIVPEGMAYNSYVILDNKISVFDTVEAKFGKQWLENLKKGLNGRQPDYLIVQHMEPDHSANIARFAAEYPAAVIVASAKAFVMMKQFYGEDFAARRLIVGDGSVLELGRHHLTFLTAPMVHWPEVIMTYDSTDKVLFSADAFGKFGAVDGEETDWACEARRYYFGIVGKYGAQVQALLKKALGLEITAICPLHGPILSGEIGGYLRLYQTWSSYEPEDNGVLIAYTSVYGHTRAAAEYLAELLRAKGEKAVVTDLARSDMAEAVEDAFRYSKLVLATTTYNTGIFPYMRTFIETLTEHGYQNRTVAMIENGTWAPTAAKVMRGMLEGCKNIRFAEHTVKLLSAMSEENKAELSALAAELSN